jgi:RNA polymerase sigma-70 factor (ECF subfamily)
LNASSQPPPNPEAFATTHWTRVLEAAGDSSEAKAALGELCALYYTPVHAFIRREARHEEAAQDLTQEFFSRLLGRQGIHQVDPSRGRFRSFLLGAVKHFLADMRDRDARLKRGAGYTLEPLQPETDTSPGLQMPDTNAPSPDQVFDRKWALTLLDRALAVLTEEHKAAGKIEQFEVLKVWLTGDNETISQGDAARQLGVNEGTVKVAIHRLRRRFREVIKMEIGRTVQEAAQVDDELTELLQSLR